MGTKYIFTEHKGFAECHASTLAELQDGRILAAWFGGTHEGNPDTSIWGAYYDPSAKEWAEVFLLVKVNAEAHWNPVLFQAPTGETHLFFRTGQDPTCWSSWHMEMPPGGSWSSPEPLAAEDENGSHDRGPVRSKPILLSDGTLLAPSSHERRPAGFYYDPSWNAFADLSGDMGKTWNRTEYIKRGRWVKNTGMIQPTAWESSPGNVHMLFRTKWGNVYRSDSTDYGRTWMPAYLLSIPNNNSGIDLAQGHDGSLALVFNPVSGNWSSRTPLSISVSSGKGDKFSSPVHIETNERGTFSYPSVIRTARGFAVTYTWCRVTIAFREFSVSPDFKTVTMLDADEEAPRSLMDRRIVRRARKLGVTPMELRAAILKESAK